jgi:hypothetical protein
MHRWASGKAARIPMDALVHHIARRYGQTPAAVRDWPADDFLMAAAYDPFLSPRAASRPR